MKGRKMMGDMWEVGVTGKRDLQQHQPRINSSTELTSRVPIGT